MLKRIGVFVLALVLLLSYTTVTHAEGSGNAEGGGGNVNQGTKKYNWPGTSYQGVRITIVSAESGTIVNNPFDLTNKDISRISDTIYHFGKKSKLQYRNGAALSLQTSGYAYFIPNNPMPQVISGNSSKASIAMIKRYFCSDGAAAMIARYSGMSTEDLTSGAYKVIIEPVIYLIYNNLYYAMTTTEAGLYNRMVDGDLGSHFPTVVMKNLALALFLERDDLGFSAWSGSTKTARSTEEMIEQLGIGIISYKGAPPVPGEYDVEYRVDTDVISAVTLRTEAEINSEEPATVTFLIDGQNYQMQGVVIPAGRQQQVWVKWHTPEMPKEITIEVSADKGQLSNHVIRANVVDLDENPPPDPQADDRNDGFAAVSTPDKADITSLTWGIWRCWWEPNWVWAPDWVWVRDHEEEEGGHWEDNGDWEDQGWFAYEWIPYTASFMADMHVKPDEKNPTAQGKKMKSGYGFQIEATGQIRSGAPADHITQVQTAVTYFPEFAYTDYWRLLDRTSSGYTASFQFKRNEYSTYNSRAHFSPVWFPDGSYAVYTEVYDAWTPAGMLQMNLHDTLQIDDNLFADWHVRPLE